MLNINTTPQAKIAGVNARQGNPNQSLMQGSSRTLIDALPANAATTLRFFENCNLRTFPETNLSSNKLEVGESVAIQRISFLRYINTAGVITGVTTLAASIPEAQLGQFTIQIANNRVLKRFGMQLINPAVNAMAQQASNTGIIFDTYIVIPPLQEFVVELQLPAYAAVANAHIQCIIHGSAGILNPRTTY